MDRAQVLVIAGFDPTGGAGILADIKTMENLGVYAYGVPSAWTIQNSVKVFKSHWLSFQEMKDQLEVLFEETDFKVCKIGIVENIGVLHELVDYLKLNKSTIKIILDPILQSSSGYNFHQDIDQNSWKHLLQKLYMITPNYNEMLKLSLDYKVEEIAKQWSAYCHLLLKGGHHPQEKGTDYLFSKGQYTKICGQDQILSAKHGSGCVLSSAIAAFVAQGNDLLTACTHGKDYIERFLNSNATALGYHSGI